MNASILTCSELSHLTIQIYDYIVLRKTPQCALDIIWEFHFDSSIEISGLFGNIFEMSEHDWTSSVSSI